MSDRTDAMVADPAGALAAVTEATTRLLATARTLDDDAVREPSLLPGWTRGHVLGHVAGNADGLANLLDWARTGVERPQYTSWSERDAAIEERAARPAAEHLADLAAAAQRFADAAGAVPADRWDVPVRGISGPERPARHFLWARRREVEIHHVDLAAGYRPEDWPGEFVAGALDEALARLAATPEAPALVVRATDIGLHVAVGAGTASTVSGPAVGLLAWLTGRSAGESLHVEPGGRLPTLPPWG